MVTSHTSQVLFEFLSYHIFIANHVEDKGLTACIIYYIDDTNIFDKVNIAVMHVVI